MPQNSLSLISGVVFVRLTQSVTPSGQEPGLSCAFEVPAEHTRCLMISYYLVLIGGGLRLLGAGSAGYLSRAAPRLRRGTGRAR